MAINPIAWDSLNGMERAALAKAGESSPLAFTSLWFNVSQMDSFRANWHHHYYNYVAERMISGQSQNNIINIPPGGSKTEFWSIHLPVYAMIKNPRVRILNTSYSKDLVNENSSRSRDLVKSSEFQEFYNFEIGKDKVDDWTIEKDGKRIHQIFSRPSGGQITGVRGGYMSDGFSGYITADDWDKMDDLFSDAKRKKSHTRLINTLRSRRAGHWTPFAFIQQRGHLDDSTAFLLSGGMGMPIHSHIKIPALIDEEYIKSLPTKELQDRCRRDVCNHDAVNGQWSYWPAKESLRDLVALRSANPYTFTSQYMQEPESLDGGIFSSDDFLFYGSLDEGADIELPEFIDYRFITVDTAQKTNEWNDWTVFAEWGVAEGKLFRMSFLRARLDAKKLRQEFESFCNACHAKNSGKYGNLRYANVEDKVSGTGLIQETRAKLPFPINAVQRQKDKLTRAMDAAPHHAAQKVCLPFGDQYNYEFTSEIASFSHDDSHKFDDQTDVMMDAIEDAFIKPAFKTKSTIKIGRKRRR